MQLRKKCLSVLKVVNTANKILQILARVIIKYSKNRDYCGKVFKKDVQLPFLKIFRSETRLSNIQNRWVTGGQGRKAALSKMDLCHGLSLPQGK